MGAAIYRGPESLGFAIYMGEIVRGLRPPQPLSLSVSAGLPSRNNRPVWVRKPQCQQKAVVERNFAKCRVNTMQFAFSTSKQLDEAKLLVPVALKSSK